MRSTRRTLLVAMMALAALPAVAGPAPRPPGPDLGAEAPDFELRKLESQETVRLSTFRGDRPVALVFGSYT